MASDLASSELTNFVSEYLKSRRLRKEADLAASLDAMPNNVLPDALASLFEAAEPHHEDNHDATGVAYDAADASSSIPSVPGTSPANPYSVDQLWQTYDTMLNNPIDLLSSSNLHTFLTLAMFVTGVVTILATVFVVTAPYGRHSTAVGYGRLVPAKAAWMIMESPNLWWCLFYYHKHNGVSHLPSANAILIAMFCGHYINRSLVYPLRLSSGSKPMPLAVMLSAAFYCSWNGFIQSKFLFELHMFPSEHLISTRFLVGTMMWFAGFCINYHSDDIMRNLRKPGETGYKIPVGGMFEYVSGANFFGEIMEWTGYGIAGGPPGVAFAWFTFCNTAPRGAAHHKWYLDKFGDAYPKNRKAVIPFIW
jgi:3-oxo-5-alpha-steroid 4-dehydrogenase 1